MPVSFDEKRIRVSSAENDAPLTPTVLTKSSMLYCREGTEARASALVGDCSSARVGEPAQAAIPHDSAATRTSERYDTKDGKGECTADISWRGEPGVGTDDALQGTGSGGPRLAKAVASAATACKDEPMDLAA